MAIPLDAVSAKFPSHKSPRRTARGTEVVIETCPLDPNHKPWKFGINLDTGWAYCYICKPQKLHAKDVLGDTWRLRKTRREVVEPKPELELPPLPYTESLEEAGPIHPAALMLGGRKRPTALVVAHAAGMRWKPAGFPAWTKLDDKGKKVFIGLQGGLVIPVYLRGQLIAWQFAPEDRKPEKYLNAPSSKMITALYNYDRASKSSVGVIVEGVFDALRIPDVGMGILTDNITDRKVRLLSTAGFDELILCLDSDRTEAMVMKQLNKIRSCAPKVRAVKLEGGDPDDHTAIELRGLLGID